MFAVMLRSCSELHVARCCYACRVQHLKVRKTLQRLEDEELSRQYFRADGRYCRLKDDAGLHLYTTPEQMSEVIKAVGACPTLRHSLAPPHLVHRCLTYLHEEIPRTIQHSTIPAAQQVMG